MQNILEINIKKVTVLLLALFISGWHMADTSPHIVRGEDYSYTLLQDKPSQKNSIKEVNRVKEAFKNYYLNQGLYSEENGIVVGYDEEVVEEYIENHNCGFIWD